ncbi:MAG TPA: hypothetical protein ENG00_00715, partial [Candidatus Aenigmarchaeota archaeon]|nr:hypothetical protein [Candidatus Aenigmarchaeota archaeon]
MNKKAISFMLIFISIPTILSTPVCAKIIETPEAVRYLHARVSKSGSVFLEPEGILARVDSMNISLSIPQNTVRQKSRLISVEGPDSYQFFEDEWGNRVINLYWKNPDIGRDIDYEIIFDVEVSEKQEPAPGKTFPITDLIRPTEEIRRLSYKLATGLDEERAILKLAEWVYNAVDYRRDYRNLEKSGEWVFRNRKAVCDGHSNLLITMLRSLGYNAYYVAGYAYTEETLGTYWGPHGWVEVELNGRLISIDPTWLESPVDSTHIKFSNSPDSN